MVGRWAAVIIVKEAGVIKRTAVGNNAVIIVQRAEVVQDAAGTTEMAEIINWRVGETKKLNGRSWPGQELPGKFGEASSS